MKESRVRTYEEALRLLGLKRRTARSRKAIDEAYAGEHKKWTRSLNAALTPEMRARASEVIALLHEARKICMNNTGAKPQNKQFTRTRSARQASSPSSWSRFVLFLRNIYLAVAAVFKFMKAFVLAVGETIRLIVEVAKEAEAAGIPRIVLILVFLFVLVMVFNGCSEVATKITGG